MTLLQSTPIFLISFILFLLIIGFYLLGYRIRKSISKKRPQLTDVDLKAINGMLLGLLGLLLAFTFGMSNSRFNDRRNIIINEATIIGTTILRTDIYPDSIRVRINALLREYVELRIAFYEAGMDMEETLNLHKKAEEVSKKAWVISANYAKVDELTTRTSQLLPSLTDMIDIAGTRRATGLGTIPDSIMYFLLALCCCAAFLLGYDHKGKIDWIVVTVFALMLTTTVFNIIDLDRPRSGVIDMDMPHQRMIDLRGMFPPDAK